MFYRFERWARRSAIYRGFLYIFAPSAIPTRKTLRHKTDAQRDEEAIAGDWLAIGDDLRYAIKEERRHINASRDVARRDLVELHA